jgi:hypothetical protein
MALSENVACLNFCVMLIETKFRHLQIKDYIKILQTAMDPAQRIITILIRKLIRMLMGREMYSN